MRSSAIAVWVICVAGLPSNAAAHKCAELLLFGDPNHKTFLGWVDTSKFESGQRPRPRWRVSWATNPKLWSGGLRSTLAEIRHRSEVVEYRVEQHLERLGDRLQRLGLLRPSDTGKDTAINGACGSASSWTITEVKVGQNLRNHGPGVIF